MNSLLGICLTIFFGRIVDVSLGTLRTMFTVKEKSLQAAACGFGEVFIWFIVVRNALNSDLPVLVLALCYAGGYATGTFIGGKLAKKFVGGHVTIEVITSNRSATIPEALRAAGYALTVINVNESEFGEKKYLILADVNVKRTKIFQDKIKELDPGAFMLVRETKSYTRGISRPGK